MAAGAGSHTISFRPAQPGPVTVFSAATGKPQHSESGQLGAVHLRTPGNVIVASASSLLTQNALGLTHQATAAELATPGNWTCTITNSTEASISFKTDITFVQELHDISFGEVPSAIMGYYNAAQLRMYDQFAKDFAICDPNRAYGHRLFSFMFQFQNDVTR